MLQGTKNEYILLGVSYSEWDANLYPRAKLYNSGGTELGASPKDLTYVANGYYQNDDWIPTGAGYYQAVFITYTDAGHTTSSQNYGIASESILIEDSTSLDLSTITPELDYISSQMIALSSQIKSSTYGGGGKSYYVPGGKKSPWSHQQRDEVIKFTKETREIVEKLEKDIETYHQKEIKLIDKIISLLRSLQVRLESAKTEEDVMQIKKDIDVVSNMLATVLSDEALEKLVNK